MNQTKAKALRKMAYGNLSSRAINTKYKTFGKTMVSIGPRRAYQLSKNERNK